jgi:hypothetical protein
VEKLRASHDQPNPAIRCLCDHQTTGSMSAARAQLKFALLSGMLSWPTASLPDSLLPSQDQPTFFNVRICRDRQVLAVLKAAASSTLKTDVIVAHGKGSKWSGYDPNDIHLEAVSVSPDDEANSVFCSVTISAKGITERIVYVVSVTLGSWQLRFGGGETRSEMGGHALFPEGPITVEPTKRND